MNITLRCPHCKRTLSVERLPNDPPQADVVEVLCCGQWSESAHYFDAQGRELYGDTESKDFGKPLAGGECVSETKPQIPDFSEVGKQRSTAADVNDTMLFCYGCAHSAADKPFPSMPSGERPCFFCVRNRERDKVQADFEKRWGHKLMEWYDGSPIAFYPMDAYQTIDMKEQQERWFRRDKGDPNWNEPKGGLRFG